MDTKTFDTVMTAIQNMRDNPPMKQTFVFYVKGKKYTIKAESYSIAYWVILPKLIR